MDVLDETMRVISQDCVLSTRAQHFPLTIYEHTSNIPSNLLVTEAEGEYAFVSRHRSPDYLQRP